MISFLTALSLLLITPGPGVLSVAGVINRMRGGTFVHGGHGRKKRLAVIDAAPIDNRRRLVLVRRDDVEHLVLIGGMNDLVVEQDIGNQASSADMRPVSMTVTKPQPADQPGQANQPPIAAPVPAPEPKPIAAATKREPAPIPQKAPKREIEPQPEPPVNSAPAVAPPPIANTDKVVASSSAAVAASAVVGAQLVEQETTNANMDAASPKPQPVSSNTQPAEPSFSEFVSRETAQATSTVASVEETKIQDPIPELVDEFAPISAPEPAIGPDETSPLETDPLEADPLAETDEANLDADLEDEMEQLLNKLTSSS